MKPLNGEASFEQLFRQYWNKVHHLCARYCGDDDVAKDLTQDIFLSLWQRKKDFPDRESIEKYLTKTAKYRVIAYMRDHKKESGIRDVHAPDVYLESDAPNPESELDFNQLAEQTQTAIQSLPEPSRTIFLLNREQEMTYQQIASVKGLSLKSIEFHISKSLKILRKNLGLQRPNVV